MNENNNEFHDPLDDVIARATGKFGLNESNETNHHQEETSFTNQESTPIVTFTENDTLDDDDVYSDDPLENEAPVGDYDDDDDPYGNNDFNNEIAEEDRQREMIAEQKRREAEAAKQEMADKTTALPPRSLDKDFQKESIDFQTNNLAIVTGMVEQVKAKYHLKGGIKNDRLRMVMGDLMEEYYAHGETITPEFEQIIMKNWTYADADGTEYDAHSNAPVNNTNGETVVNNNAVNNAEPVNVNIEVAPDQPVTVNIDDEIVNSINKKRVVNINVREVTNKDMEKVTIIENSPREGIIRSFDTGLGYTPLTLPLSAYRCVIKPLNFFQMMSLASPDSDSMIDYQLKRWKTVYEHLKNPSIGDFVDFEDFLKKTKYNDMTLLEWGLLTATSDDEETITLECGNPKCKKEFVHAYSPRTLIHPNVEKLPKKFKEIGNASGNQALELYDEIASKRVRYRLPRSGVVIEIEEPSAYTYLTQKLPLIVAKYTERFPEDPKMEKLADPNQRNNDPRMMEFSIMMSMMMRITAIIIPPPEDDNFDKPHEYRYTTWDDIEDQLGLLQMEDTLAIFKIVSEEDDSQPMEFYVADIKCPHCGREEPRGLPVTNLIQNLIFRVSRRLQNTEINLTRLD